MAALAYYGEAWIAEHARPAPGWVMIYSNACYAPGAGEGFDEPADEETAAGRVSAYSRAPLADLGASAYFATDFYEGAAHLVAALLDAPDLPFGDVFASEPNFVADAVARLPHAEIDGAETWLQRSPYFEGKEDYWYAFAGDPAGTLSGGSAAFAATIPGPEAIAPLAAFDGLVTGMASSYGESAGWEGMATVALPARDRRRHPHRRPELGAGVRRPLRLDAGRRFVPVLCRHGGPAGREPLARGVAPGHGPAARGRACAGRAAPLPHRATVGPADQLRAATRP